MLRIVMKLLVFLYHFFLSGLVPAMLIFFVFAGDARYFVLGGWSLAWCVLYTYMDKIILFFLGAREIIDQDNQELFQQLKSETYKEFEKMPKVYLYSGKALKVFLLESRGEWSVVLERGLVSKLDEEKSKSLVKYLVNFKKKDVAWRMTKSHGLAALVLGLNFTLWAKVFIFNPKGKAKKIANVFALALLKPYVEAVIVLGKSSFALDCDQSLEPLINMGKDLEPGLEYGPFLMSNLQDEANPKDLLVRRLELFPVIELASVKRSF